MVAFRWPARRRVWLTLLALAVSYWTADPLLAAQYEEVAGRPAAGDCVTGGQVVDCDSSSSADPAAGEHSAQISYVPAPCTWEMQLVDPTGGRHPGGIHRDPAMPGLVPPGPGPTTETWYAWNCDGPSGLRFAWFPSSSPPALTAADLLPGVVDRARGLIPSPILAMAPPESASGVVNVGMFLAIEPPAAFVVRSEAGSVWVQAQVALDSTVWDMGNGDVVECVGPGVPWDGSDVPADVEGPCGYTYRWPSSTEFTGRAEQSYAASVTARWSVRVTASDGRDELTPPIDAVRRFDYVVVEIQTVGVPTG